VSDISGNGIVWDVLLRDIVWDVLLKKEKFIDEIINSDLPDKFYIDTERVDHYVRADAYIYLV
jgi:hypothetical protein